MREVEPAERASWSSELTETIRRRYGLSRLEVDRDLGGGYNLNMLAHADAGDLVIRVYQPWLSQARLAAQQQVRRYLKARGWPVAPLRPAGDGRGYVCAGDRLVEVEGYVPGGSRMNTWKTLRAGMPWFARLHDTLAGMPVPQAARVAPVANHVAGDRVVELADTAGRSIAGWGLSELEQQYLLAARRLAGKLAAIQTEDLPRQLVHGDFWDNNVFLAGERLVLLTDFDFVGIRPRVDDLALTLFFANEQAGRNDRSADRVAQLKRLVDAYDRALERPLHPQERAALPYAMARSPLTFLRDMAANGAAGRAELTALRGPEYRWGLQVLDSRVWLDGFLGLPAGKVASMRVGMSLNYAGGFTDTVAELADYEKAGLNIVFVPEAYSYDAVSQLGFIAARTERLQIASGILQIYSRTPALTAMTAAGLDYVSGGRFTLGLGASGPQVIEGWHGVPYDAPVGRSREIIEICRMVWRRERLEYHGKHYELPLGQGGTGLGKPLKLINHPVRDRIPVVLAALGPKNVALAAELAEGWQPIFYVPEKASAVWGTALAEGQAKREESLGTLDIIANVPLAIGPDVTGLRELARPLFALYIGGMGARGKNFYNDLAIRYGYEKQAKAIQDAYLDGRKDEAAALVPAELTELTSLIGTESYVRERVAALRESGVTTLNVTPLAPDHRGRVALIERIRDLSA